MEERIRISYVLAHNPGFRIRTKKDAGLFWKDVFVSGEIRMEDKNDQNQILIFQRPARGGTPLWGARYKWWEWYQPDVLNSGYRGGINFAWYKRKSINAWLKEQEAEDE